MQRPLLALFDVDETLIRVKSMFSLLDKILLAQGWYEPDRQHAVERFQRLADSGESREKVNAAYYRGFAGFSRKWVMQQGREWFIESSAEGTLFHNPVLAELEELRDRGTIIALVSGSFEACLEPIANAVRANYVLASRPTTNGDIYTGELQTRMIGQAKGNGAANLIEDLKLDPSLTRAYGDHPSDAALLRAVNEGVVVGRNPEMLRLAYQEGWRVLPTN